MKFSEALADEEERSRKGPLCTLAVITSGLDDTDRKALDDALASNAANTLIVRALASIGYRVSAQTLSRHRRGECSCG